MYELSLLLLTVVLFLLLIVKFSFMVIKNPKGFISLATTSLAIMTIYFTYKSFGDYIGPIAKAIG